MILPKKPLKFPEHPLRALKKTLVDAFPTKVSRSAAHTRAISTGQHVHHYVQFLKGSFRNLVLVGDLAELPEIVLVAFYRLIVVIYIYIRGRLNKQIVEQ